MAASRADSLVQPPAEGRDYSGFPSFTIRDGHEWFRAHLARHSPWWFSNNEGRFNLEGNRGTLNTASSAQVAVQEFLGPTLARDGAVNRSLLAELVISTLPIPGCEVADFLHPAAPSYGIVAGDFSGPLSNGYGTTRVWAQALDRAGHEGIRARSRFGSGTSPTCLYLFGDAGVNELATAGVVVDAVSVAEHLEGVVVEDVATAAEIRIEGNSKQSGD